MYIIGRVNVNATAFSFSPLSLSVIQRHDLWLVSDFRRHPSSPGFTTGLRAVNHAEGCHSFPLTLPGCASGSLGEDNFVRQQPRGLGGSLGLVQPGALIA